MPSVSSPYDVVQGGEVQIGPTERKLVPRGALLFAGGGTIENDPQDKQGLSSKTNNFTVYVSGLVGADGGAWPGVPGERVALRFALPRRPLIEQWLGELEKMISGRGGIF